MSVNSWPWALLLLLGSFALNVALYVVVVVAGLRLRAAAAAVAVRWGWVWLASPGGWLGSGGAVVSLAWVRRSRVRRLVWLARALGASGVSVARCGSVVAVWPWGCVGSRVFAWVC